MTEKKDNIDEIFDKTEKVAKRSIKLFGIIATGISTICFAAYMAYQSISNAKDSYKQKIVKPLKYKDRFNNIPDSTFEPKFKTTTYE